MEEEYTRGGNVIKRRKACRSEPGRMRQMQSGSAASAVRKELFQPKDLVSLAPCDEPGMRRSNKSRRDPESQQTLVRLPGIRLSDEVHDIGGVHDPSATEALAQFLNLIAAHHVVRCKAIEGCLVIICESSSQISAWL